MVKIEQLNAAKAVFIRSGNEQPAFLNAILTDTEFKTFKVLEGSVTVSINETEVKVITAGTEPENKTASLSDTVTMEITSVDTKSESASTDAVVTASEKVQVAEIAAPVIVKPVPRARK